MKGLKTLVLNADYRPIDYFPLETIPAEDAITRCVNGTCMVVEEYDIPVKTPTAKMNWPSVIARTEFLNHEHALALSHKNVFYRDHGKCAYCGDDLTIDEVTFDHVCPVSLGGKREWTNIVAACAPCNSQKSSQLWTPNVRVYEPTYHELLEKRREHPIYVESPSWEPYIQPWYGEVKIRNSMVARV